VTERTRFPLHTERAAEAHRWAGIGWTDCGEHPSLPGWRVLEWRSDNGFAWPACPYDSPEAAQFVEWMMGFPIGWTELAPSETPSSLISLKSSGGQS
jgi:hypothetical protein